MRRAAQLAVVAALGATAFVPSTASAYIPPCQQHLNPYALNVPGAADCAVDAGVATVIRVGNCTLTYDPLSPPFITNAVPETQAYADCLA